MNIDCQWVEKNLEAMFSGDLSAEESQHARTHIQSCQPCRKEVQALIAIDPVIKKYFQAQLAKALRSGDAPVRSRRTARWTIQTAAVALVAIVLVVLLRTPQGNNLPSSVPLQPAAAPIASIDSPSVIKNDVVSENERSKPSPTGTAERKTPGEGTNAATATIAAVNAPAFLVADPAGYSHSLQDYRGFKVILCVWSPDQQDSIASIERLYRAFGADTKLRFIGVSNQRAAKPASTTFPVFYNQGSHLLDAKPGDFVVVDESGTVTLRGSLTADFENLSKTLR
jgi:hypothetical protein